MEISFSVPGVGDTVAGWLKGWRVSLRALWRRQHKRRSLVVKETAGLGDRRFVAVLQFEHQRFLIGGSAGSVTLLAHLPEDESMREQP